MGQIRISHSIYIFLFLLLMPCTPQPLNITIREFVSYNVTYNATTDSEYPDESSEKSLYIPSVTGEIIIENNAMEDIADINITLSKTANLTGIPVFDSFRSETSAKIFDIDGWNEDSGGRLVIHIPKLPKNAKVYFNYEINSTEIVEPINITKNVTTRLGNGRVFNNENFNVSITLHNILEDSYIIINLTEIAHNNFTFNNETNFMKSTEGYTEIVDNSTIIWTDIILERPNSTARLDFTVKSPNSTTAVDESEQDYNKRKNYVLLEFGHVELNFTANNSLSDLIVEKVEARPNIIFSVSKGRTDAFNWTIIPAVRNPTYDLYYRIKRVSVWAIPSINIASDLDPGDKSKWLPNSYYQWNSTTYPEVFNETSPILCFNDDSPGGCDEWNNGTDLHNASHGHTFFNDSVVPVVWGSVDLTLVDNSSMVARIFETKNQSGRYVYYQKILFLYSYFLEAEKTVENIDGQGIFKITIKLTNLGVAITPNSTLLADLVPENMRITNLTGDGGEEGIEINSTDSSKDYTLEGFENGILWSKYSGYNFTGKSPASGVFIGAWTYFWELKPLKPQESIYIVYYLNGTGDYYPGELYIVGVDPVQTNRVAASKTIITTDGFKLASISPETLPASLTFTMFLFSLFFRKRLK